MCRLGTTWSRTRTSCEAGRTTRWYWAVIGQSEAILSCDWSEWGNTELWLVRGWQYWAVIGQRVAILSCDWSLGRLRGLWPGVLAGEHPGVGADQRQQQHGVRAGGGHGGLVRQQEVRQVQVLQTRQRARRLQDVSSEPLLRQRWGLHVQVGTKYLMSYWKKIYFKFLVLMHDGSSRNLLPQKWYWYLNLNEDVQ